MEERGKERFVHLEGTQRMPAEEAKCLQLINELNLRMLSKRFCYCFSASAVTKCVDYMAFTTSYGLTVDIVTA